MQRIDAHWDASAQVKRNFSQRAVELLWLFDKQLQPHVVRRLAGADLHLPTLASATAAELNRAGGGRGGRGQAGAGAGARAGGGQPEGDCGAWATLEAAAARQLRPGGEGCVVKPINGGAKTCESPHALPPCL